MARMPRRLPSPSSPTSPTKRTVRCDDDNLFFIHAAQFADNIAGLVDLDRETGFGQQGFDRGGALRFLKRRRRDFRNARLLVVDPGNIGSEPIESGADSGVVGKA